MKKNKIIHTERYVARPVVADDIEHIFTGLSHPKVIKYYGVSFKTLEETNEQMDWYRNLEHDKKGQWWVIESIADKTFVGAGGFNDWDHTSKKAEIGFWLLPEFWGQGIMKETFPKIVEYGHIEMNLRRIEGFVESDNMKCKRALEKVNFQYEGTMRECEWKNGEFISIDIYSSISENGK